VIIPLPEDTDHPLVVACRRDFEAAGQLDTVDGAVVLLLARYLAVATGRGVVALSRELRAAYARAIAGREASVGFDPRSNDPAKIRQEGQDQARRSQFS
jgi:hypothetical protein